MPNQNISMKKKTSKTSLIKNVEPPDDWAMLGTNSQNEDPTTRQTRPLETEAALNAGHKFWMSAASACAWVVGVGCC